MAANDLALANIEMLNARANAARVAADRNATPEAKKRAQDALNTATAKVTSLMPAQPQSGSSSGGSNYSEQGHSGGGSKSTFSKALPWALGGLGVLTVGIIGYKFYHRKKG